MLKVLRKASYKYTRDRSHGLGLKCIHAAEDLIFSDGWLTRPLLSLHLSLYDMRQNM